ncbi:unnamed protein product [Rotaria sp. Silwood1]|nr:unnamed protein product [Rotaria sp. Silwood1]
MAIVNIQTVIVCGSSIDIYSSFDPNQIVICPYVLIEKDKTQFMNMSISFDNYGQIIIELNPRIISTPKLLIKLDNNSFILAPSINQNYTYYLSFSSELTCRYSLLNNETICFYYSIATNFIHIEYHYDKIKYDSFILSMMKQEAATQPPELPKDSAIKQPMLAEDLIIKKTYEFNNIK